MEPNEIQVDQVYFNYGPNFPRKVIKICDDQVVSTDVSYGHGFYVCPVATQYQSTLSEFAEWAQVSFTTSEIAKKDKPLIPPIYRKDRK